MSSKSPDAITKKLVSRAKFLCTTATVVKHSNTLEPGLRSFLFVPVSDNGIPENQRFHRYTPCGKLEITVDNPAVVFEPGKSYYLDFTEAEE